MIFNASLCLERPNATELPVEIIPVLQRNGERLINVGVYILYRSIHSFKKTDFDTELYQNNFDSHGIFIRQASDFLGEIEFLNGQLFEWIYTGEQLVDFEVHQLIEFIQNYSENDDS